MGPSVIRQLTLYIFTFVVYQGVFEVQLHIFIPLVLVLFVDVPSHLVLPVLSFPLNQSSRVNTLLVTHALYRPIFIF